MASSANSPTTGQSFTITDRDLERIEDFFLEAGVPHTLTELAQQVIQGRAEEEAARLRKLADQNAVLYQPKHAYQVGQRLRFPALDDAVGAVEAVRPGDNPALGAFSVLRVRLEHGGVREFAADYTGDHVLNHDEVVQPTAAALASVEPVSEAIGQRLAKLPDYVSFGDYWFRRDLMPDVHVGYLNIAEALIDVAGEAQATGTLVKEVEVPDGPDAVRAFALNYALAHDPDQRFVNTGSPDAPRWALRQGVTA